MRLGDLDALKEAFNKDIERFGDVPWHISAIETEIDALPTIDAVPVVRCKRVKEEILQRMDEFIMEYKSISESAVDHFGGKADAMDVARRLVNAALTDLCSYGERKDGGN